jgi:toxin ParE1/3/4
MTAWYLTPAAQADLDDIFDYTARTWDVVQAERYVLGLRKLFDIIAADGWRGARLSGRDEPLFRYPGISHVVFFERDATSIRIIRILHKRMDADIHLRSSVITTAAIGNAP